MFNTGTFTAMTQTESNYGSAPQVTVSTITDGHNTTIADVRRLFGATLQLTSDHAAWVAGERVNDNYTPQAGMLVTFKRAAKDRGNS